MELRRLIYVPGTTATPDSTKFSRTSDPGVNGAVTSEIDPDVVRRKFWPSMGIGAISFAAPYAGVLLIAHYIVGWPWPQAQIAGISMSTTRCRPTAPPTYRPMDTIEIEAEIVPETLEPVPVRER